MKRQLLILLLMSVMYSSHGQVFEDFSDGDFKVDPIWTTSNDDLWQVNAQQLQSNSPEAASYWISTPSNAANNGIWEFNIKLEFATSGVNYVDIFLLSDSENLSLTTDGYFVRVGDTQDEIVLYKLEDGITTPLIDEAEGVVNSSSNNSFKINVTRDADDNWELFYDDGLTGSFISAGTQMDNTILFSEYFGFLIVQSGAASPVMGHFFDDISVSGEPFADVQPPELISSELQSRNQLVVSFNEALSELDAVNNTNYTVDNNYGNPDLAELIAPNQVLLTFEDDFVTGNYLLTVDNIQDLNGNASGMLMLNFSLFVPDIPEVKDILITEIFADPTPSIGLPDADFIELFNASNKTFDLASWVLTDAVGESILPSYILEPGSFLILCSTSQIDSFSSFGATLGLSSFPNFNNSQDVVKLLYTNDTVVDQVEYDDSWYGDSDKEDGGFSLELINPNDVCGLSNNWIASDDVQGGTPGEQNSVWDEKTGTEIPSIDQLRIVNANELLIEFSEPIDSLSLDIHDLSIDNNITIQSFVLDQNFLHILTINPFQTTILYSLTLLDFTDCTGNQIEGLSASFEYFVNPNLALKDLVITEIMANPNEETSAPNAEYLEVYNRSALNLNLEGWLFSDISSTVELPYYILPANSYLLLIRENDSHLFDSAIPLLGLESMPTLNNDGDILTIRSEVNTLLDSVNYDASWYRSSIKDDGGFSLELIDLDDFCSDELNWVASEDPSGGTPGFQNSVFSSIPDNRGPELLSVVGISADTIRLEFNELLDLSSILNAEYIISNNTNVKKVISADLKTVYLILSKDSFLSGGVQYEIEVVGIRDCPGNAIVNNSKGSFSLIENAKEGDIIINEILFNPRPGGVDFVEIYNQTNKFISLKNWAIANGEIVDDSLFINTDRTLASDYLVIEPNEYFAFTSDEIIVKDQYPRSNEAAFIPLNSLPSFPDEEGLVILINSSGTIMDFFNYSEDFHASVISDEEGVSLERISFDQPTNNSENWFSAAKKEGFATPGYLNSQSKLTSSQRGTITINPEIVVPDGDGQNDFTTISYSLPEPGYVATTRIFTISGLLIKTIATNDFLSQKGFYTWDGSDDNGQALRVGYYILYFEAFHSGGDLIEIKKKIAVGAKF